MTNLLPPPMPPPDAEPKSGKTVEELVLDLGTSMHDGFAKMNANIGLVSSEIDVVKGRLGVVEERQNSTDEWRQKNSDRAGAMSNADMANEAKLAAEIVARGALEKRVAAIDAKQDAQLVILANIQKLMQNPTVRAICTAAGAAILAWLATKGFH